MRRWTLIDGQCRTLEFLFAAFYASGQRTELTSRFSRFFVPHNNSNLHAYAHDARSEAGNRNAKTNKHLFQVCVQCTGNLSSYWRSVIETN
jgi:hypothetical protein